jgi:hypothetical protein
MAASQRAAGAAFHTKGTKEAKRVGPIRREFWPAPFAVFVRFV